MFYLPPRVGSENIHKVWIKIKLKLGWSIKKNA